MGSPRCLFLYTFVYICSGILIKKAQSWEFSSWLAEMNPTSISEDMGSIPGLAQWVKDPGLSRAVV